MKRGYATPNHERKSKDEAGRTRIARIIGGYDPARRPDQRSQLVPQITASEREP